ncbi:MULTISPECIES: MASE3 domain-containing protein [Desulfosediminicola]|uniref:MASE3 domain-containing protein n=1 Tax=Desulfosediminicola TaxID=2886823 RepID=UPI0010AD6976|nr:MASE3 domain-containing protein [Desulfosediminicola ganghwensis]
MQQISQEREGEGIGNTLQTLLNYTVILGTLIGLYFTIRINYLVFHILAEGYSIIIASSIFVIAWNSKKYIHNPYLLFIGIAYFFIALVDLLHTMAYKGMPLFTDYDYYANQLWIVARYIESITLLVAFAYMRLNRMPRVNLVFIVYTIVTALCIASIFYWKIFPECFVEGQGQTMFKIISEYVICAILVTSVYLLVKNRSRFSPKIFYILLASILFTISSELSFTLYIDNYGMMNLVGHYFKIFSFILIYLALIKTGIEEPFNLFFLDLNRANNDLKEEIRIRKETEAEKEHLINNLTHALEEIKTLQGLLPICSFCKNIRDDKGYWNNIESYLSVHADVEFSHGLCPDCAEKNYPEFYEQ